MKRLKVILIFLLLALLSAGTAQAVAIFDNFGPGDTYETNSGWAVSYDSSVGQNFSAMGFSPSSTDYLESIELIISLGLGTNEVSLSLVNDFMGAPDISSPLESWMFTNQMGPYPGSVPTLTATSVFNPLLQAGTVYWLVPVVPQNTVAVWNYNSIGDIGPVSFSTDGGFTWTIESPSQRGVFRVNAVPEPSTMLLLLSGILGLFSFKRVMREKN